MEHFSWFTLLGLDEHYDHVLGSILVLLFLAFAGYKIKNNLAEKEQSALQDEKFTMRTNF